LLISLLGTAIGYVLFALAVAWRDMPLLFISRILPGFTGGNVSIAMSAIADISHGPRKTRNFGYIGMAFGLGFILGPFIGGKLADPTVLPWFDAATPFWFAALLTVISILLCIVLFSETFHARVKTAINPLMGFQNLAKAFTIPQAH
jgi:DHA1 family tetracycline resistance protein-like MFS transporter